MIIQQQLQTKNDLLIKYQKCAIKIVDDLDYFVSEKGHYDIVHILNLKEKEQHSPPLKDYFDVIITEEMRNRYFDFIDPLLEEIQLQLKELNYLSNVIKVFLDPSEQKIIDLFLIRIRNKEKFICGNIKRLGLEEDISKWIAIDFFKIHNSPVNKQSNKEFANDFNKVCEIINIQLYYKINELPFR
ncbi:hypothetical protein AB3Z07_21100 [Metabacillus halosaccharovorans]|uniref:hypothetical protein n=1 Tax=Metabacillus halosaccharovorans TaxID=930124 RepID=UPI0034CFA4BA